MQSLPTCQCMCTFPGDDCQNFPKLRQTSTQLEHIYTHTPVEKHTGKLCACADAHAYVFKCASVRFSKRTAQPASFISMDRGQGEQRELLDNAMGDGGETQEDWRIRREFWNAAIQWRRKNKNEER